MAQQTFTGRKRVRKFFGHIKEVAEMPNLIEVQKASYDQFLMVDEPVGGRLDEGLQAVFRSVFPISDFSGTSMLEFVRYEFEAPKYDVDECRQRGMTYAAPLKVTLRLIVFDIADLEELVVGRLLNLDEVRHLCDFQDLAEGFADTFAAGERLSHVASLASLAYPRPGIWALGGPLLGVLKNL